MAHYPTALDLSSPTEGIQAPASYSIKAIRTISQTPVLLLSLSPHSLIVVYSTFFGPTIPEVPYCFLLLFPFYRANLFKFPFSYVTMLSVVIPPTHTEPSDLPKELVDELAQLVRGSVVTRSNPEYVPSPLSSDPHPLLHDGEAIPYFNFHPRSTFF